MNDVVLSAQLLAFICDGEERAYDELIAADPAVLRDATWQVLSRLADHINDHPADEFATQTAAATQRARELSSRPNLGGGTPARSPVGFLALIEVMATLVSWRFYPPKTHEAPAPMGDPHQKPTQQSSVIRIEALFAELPELRCAVRDLYDPSYGGPSSGKGVGRPGHSTNPANTDKKWWEIDFESLRFHRWGTTSMILSCSRRKEERDAVDHLALKCVLFPWALTPAISASTREYSETYHSLGQVVVAPITSSARWILMEFEPSPTLGEYLRSEITPAFTSGERVEAARNVSKSLIAALGTLARKAEEIGEVEVGESSDRAVELRPGDNQPVSFMQHLDLSPNNVFVTSSSNNGLTMKFLDLGPNHLYTRQIGIADHDDAVYVAPEVKNRGRDATSDVYSVAVILIEILAGSPPRDGRVPDVVYEISPLLGGLLEDCLEAKHSQRLLLTPEAVHNYAHFGSYVDEVFTLALEEPGLAGSTFARVWSRISPASREPGSLLKKFLETKGLGHIADNQQARYLAVFSGLSAACWWLIWLRCSVVSFEGFVIGQGVSTISGESLAASVIGFSQGAAASKYYQMILARLTTRNAPGPYARVVELLIRTTPFVALPTTLLAVGWKPEIWPWTCAAGALMVAMVNFGTLKLGNAYLERGRSVRLTTIPERGYRMGAGYDQWWVAMTLYALVICIIAAGLQVGWLKDEPAYVIGLLLINFVIHYVTKCAIGGPAVRGGLARAFNAGRRFAVLTSRTGTTP